MSCVLVNATGLQKANSGTCVGVDHVQDSVPRSQCLFQGQDFGELIPEPQLMLTKPGSSCSLCFICLYWGFSLKRRPCPPAVWSAVWTSDSELSGVQQHRKLTLPWNRSCPSPASASDTNQGSAPHSTLQNIYLSHAGNREREAQALISVCAPSQRRISSGCVWSSELPLRSCLLLHNELSSSNYSCFTYLVTPSQMNVDMFWKDSGGGGKSVKCFLRSWKYQQMSVDLELSRHLYLYSLHECWKPLWGSFLGVLQNKLSDLFTKYIYIYIYMEQ